VNGTIRRLFCPKCGWSNIRSSELEGFLDWAAKFAGLSPLRCRSCRLRFYRPWFLARRASPLVTTRRSPPAPEVVSMPNEAAAIPQEVAAMDAVVQPGAVLLLDDDPASRKLLRRLLDREGYVVREASDTGAALAELRNTEMDLAIINLSVHETKTMVRTLRSAYPEMVLVLLSETHPFAEESEKLVFLPKPSYAFAVLQSIRHLMSRDRRLGITHNAVP
jgi:CheY-like chemotaxis protein